MAPELVPASVKPAAKPVAASRAFVTFLPGNGDYVKCVVGLAKGLRKARSAYPLVVAVLPDLTADHRRILEEQGCVVREMEPVYPPDNQPQESVIHYVNSYSKIRFWQFVEFDKMIYLNADIQVFDNIDSLFALRNGFFYAVEDCFCDRRWEGTPQYRSGYCRLSHEVHCPIERGPPPSPCFSTGMFVLEPNLCTYNDMLSTLKTTPPKSTPPLGEQGFLNFYFRSVFKPISYEYNCELPLLWHHPEMVALDEVKVVRFCAPGSKPWKYTGRRETDNVQMEYIKAQVNKLWNSFIKEDIEMLVKKWKDIYEDTSLDYKNCPQAAAAEGGTEPVNMELSIATLSEAGALPIVKPPSAA